MENLLLMPLPNKHQRRKTALPRTRTLFFLAALLAGGILAYGINRNQSGLENFLYAQITQPLEQMEIIVPAKTETADLVLDAKAALSIRVSPSGKEKTLIRQNHDLPLPIASLTKLMTATVVFEYPEIYSLEKQITISLAAAGQDDVPVWGNLEAGQNLTVRELVNKMIFYSSNDAAYALAEEMGQDQFIAAMNAKAAGIGLAGAVFYNASGLDIDGGQVNRARAADLAVLLEYILKTHPEIFGLGMQPGPYLTENGIFNLNLWDGQRMIGGKTGYTERAGGCMVIVLKDNIDRSYIHILLGAKSPETRVMEMQKMINAANNIDTPDSGQIQ